MGSTSASRPGCPPSPSGIDGGSSSRCSCSASPARPRSSAFPASCPPCRSGSIDRKSTRLNSSHVTTSRMPSSAGKKKRHEKKKNEKQQTSNKKIIKKQKKK